MVPTGGSTEQGALPPDFAFVVQGDRGCPEGWTSLGRLDWPWEVRVHVEEADGVPYLTGLSLERREHNWPYRLELPDALPQDIVLPAASIESAAITPDKLRALPVGTLRLTAAEALHGGLEAAAELFDAEMERPPPGKPWPDAHYDRVAAVCRDARARGASELGALAARWHVSKPMASNYRQEAIRRGKLDEVPRRARPVSAKRAQVTKGKTGRKR
jgi:hypothetical protein